MPRFTVKDLLLSMTLIAFGIGMLTILVREGEYVTNVFGYDVLAILFLVWIAAGGLIGAGLCTPFRHPWVGATTGAIIQLLWPLVLVMAVGL